MTTMMTRRRALIGAGAALAGLSTDALAAPPNGLPAVAKRLIVFGDSYSDLDWATYSMWSERLLNRGYVRSLVNLARAGATALNYSSSAPARMTLRSQINQFLASPGWTNKDVVVVYIGYNDVNRYDQSQWRTLAAAKAEYSTQIERLINSPATVGANRLVLATIHDWGRTPGGEPVHTTRTREWNSHVRSVVSGRTNVLRGELFSRFEDIHLRPSRYGLVNTTTPNASRASSDFLYADTFHYGARGQNLISQEFVTILERVRASRR